MQGKKWNWKLDQWMEDKVWTKFPPKEEDRSPHFFFVCGFAAGCGFAIVVVSLVKILL